MPGRTPAEAFRSFIEPIQLSVGCLGPAKIVPSRHGSTEPNVEHTWSLNGANGLVIQGGWHFDAQMRYEILPDERHEWRVRTRGYRYRLSHAGKDVFRIHWHPGGNSPISDPHFHLPLNHPTLSPAEMLNRHLPSGRMTIEEAIMWAIESGVPPARTDFEEILEESKTRHVEHRTWSDKPPDF